MPRSKRGARRKTKSASKAAAATPRRARRRPIVVALASAAAVAGVWLVVEIFSTTPPEGPFLALAAEGGPALAEVRAFPGEGRTHIAAGIAVPYRTNPPTSGPHEARWINPGFYDDPQPETRLVHSLEHGMIVVYYDQPEAQALDTLRGWARLYSGPWSGIVAVPRAGLGGTVILTAWTRMLRLSPFEPAPAAAFIDAFRGRGPERPVR